MQSQTIPRVRHLADVKNYGEARYPHCNQGGFGRSTVWMLWAAVSEDVIVVLLFEGKATAGADGET